jgi:hypothetical protein
MDQSKKHPQKIQVPKLRFIGEQDGVPERQLKSRLVELFQQDQSVVVAYLANVAYGDQSLANVTLCLRRQFGPDSGLAEKIGNIFAKMFGRHEHLDIIFLDPGSQSELIRVCSPFYEDEEMIKGGRPL